MHHFATHLRPGQQTTYSLRAKRYRDLRKRKRDQDGEEPPSSPGDDAKSPPIASSAQSFAPIEASQLRVAGLSPDDPFEIPPPPFPHGFARASKDYYNHAKVQEDIAALNPAVYAVDAKSQSQPVGGKSSKPALRATHLDVLSTVMHRCQLEGDYERAARAWGMILRTQVGGQPIDPRNHGRWGIGAEMLLHRGSRNQSIQTRNEQAQDSSIDSDPPRPEEVETFTDEGFELAREYYERLIVQHPNRKSAPHAVDDRVFYPPLFSVWIRQVCEKSKHARKQYQSELRQRSPSVSSEGDFSMLYEEARSREIAIQAEELSRAREICERLNRIIASPPLDKHDGLLCLRGNVGLWISDLVVSNDKHPAQNHRHADVSVDENDDNVESAADKIQQYTDSLRELELARQFLERAKTNGAASLRKTLSSVESESNLDTFAE